VRFHASRKAGKLLLLFHFFATRLASSKSLMLFDFDSMFALCPGTSSIIFHLTPLWDPESHGTETPTHPRIPVVCGGQMKYVWPNQKALALTMPRLRVF